VPAVGQKQQSHAKPNKHHEASLESLNLWRRADCFSGEHCHHLFSSTTVCLSGQWQFLLQNLSLWFQTHTHTELLPQVTVTNLA